MVTSAVDGVVVVMGTSRVKAEGASCRPGRSRASGRTTRTTGAGRQHQFPRQSLRSLASPRQTSGSSPATMSAYSSAEPPAAGSGRITLKQKYPGPHNAHSSAEGSTRRPIGDGVQSGYRMSRDCESSPYVTKRQIRWPMTNDATHGQDALVAGASGSLACPRSPGLWALPGVRMMIERWGLPGGRSPVLLSPLVREESFRALGCSGGLERGRG